MATIRKRGDRYLLQVRKQGFPPITKSFSCKKTAETFAKDPEARIERGVFQDSSLADNTKVSDLLDLGIYLPQGNPVSKFRLPKLPKERDRRLELEEEDRLLETFENNLLMRSLVIFAVETGMRRGEISNMQWEHINWESSTLQIPETKTDTPRTIPLSGTTIELLKVAKQVLLTQPVCDPPPGSTPESLTRF